MGNHKPNDNDRPVKPAPSESTCDSSAFFELVKKAKRGETGALFALDAELTKFYPDLLRQFGELSLLTRHAWAQKLAAGDPVALAAICKSNYERFKNLAGEEPTESERIMAEQVVLLELQLAYYERWEALNVEVGANTAMMRWMAKRQDSVRHQLQTAITRLKKVQMLEIELDKKRPAGSARLLRIFDPQAKEKAG